MGDVLQRKACAFKAEAAFFLNFLILEDSVWLQVKNFGMQDPGFLTGLLAYSVAKLKQRLYLIAKVLD